MYSSFAQGVIIRRVAAWPLAGVAFLVLWGLSAAGVDASRDRSAGLLEEAEFDLRGTTPAGSFVGYGRVDTGGHSQLYPLADHPEVVAAVAASARAMSALQDAESSDEPPAVWDFEETPEEGTPDKGRAAAGATRYSFTVDLANRVLDDRAGLAGRLGGDDDRRALKDILSVGTSAGGARAKAVLAWNPATGESRSGQVDTAAGFEHWLLKFDGVANNRDRELADPIGFGRIEYAYSRMARAAGVEMARCRLHHEGGRSHFMTRRFDRDAHGRKLQMQTLGALRHFDYNVVGAYAYEQALATIRLLGLGMGGVEQQVRRAVFNVVARNQYEHVKNIAFLMDRRGEWQLSPAYDVAYAYNADDPSTREHRMSLSGKRRGFEREDLLAYVPPLKTTVSLWSDSWRRSTG